MPSGDLEKLSKLSIRETRTWTRVSVLRIGHQGIRLWKGAPSELSNLVPLLSLRAQQNKALASVSLEDEVVVRWVKFDGRENRTDLWWGHAAVPMYRLHLRVSQLWSRSWEPMRWLHVLSNDELDIIAVSKAGHNWESLVKSRQIGKSWLGQSIMLTDLRLSAGSEGLGW